MSNLLVRLLILPTLLTLSLGALAIESVGGCFVSRPYQASEHDTMQVRHVAAGTYEVSFRLVYCNYVDSANCMNARFESFEFRAKLKNNVLSHRGPKGCNLAVRFAGPRRAWVSQLTACEEFEYWGPQGIYTRSEELEDQQGLCPP